MQPVFAYFPWLLSGLLAALLFFALIWGVGARRKLREVSEQLRSSHHRDGLTTLLNSSGLQAVLATMANKASATGGSFCVLYLGLDNFGLLNDGFGKEVGDGVLVDVGVRLSSLSGLNSEVSRVGNSEYAVVVDGDLTAGQSVARRMLNKLTEPFVVDGVPVRLSGSVGVVVFPDHCAHEKLLACAALAMRSVRAGGGGDFCVYEPQMSVEVREQALMLSQLRDAVRLGQLRLFFQPKVEAQTLQITAAEALVRWRHPERGLVSPAIFIPLAERHGLMGEIGNWVVEEACRYAGRWREKGLRMRVAVNFSAYQMREEDLVDRIERNLQRFHIQPDRFTCEITETVAMEDTRITQQTFERMRAAKFHVSIDDFGTGYSSLSTLRKLPAAELKIDRAFVADLEDSEDARAIVQSIVNMAQSLGLRVVAEGVETRAQCNILMELGCTELQGYLFSMPVPGEEIERMAMESRGESGGDFRDSLFQPTGYQPFR